jgi:hypothetical protein
MAFLPAKGWHKNCLLPRVIDDSFALTFSRLKMAGETELQHELEHQRHSRRPRAHRKADWRIFERVRAVFIFLFCATILVCAFSSRTQLQASVCSNVKRSMAERPNSLSYQIRENALNYEKEVNEVGAGQTASPSNSSSAK